MQIKQPKTIFSGDGESSGERWCGGVGVGVVKWRISAKTLQQPLKHFCFTDYLLKET